MIDLHSSAFDLVKLFNLDFFALSTNEITMGFTQTTVFYDLNIT